MYLTVCDYLDSLKKLGSLGTFYSSSRIGRRKDVLLGQLSFSALVRPITYLRRSYYFGISVLLGVPNDYQPILDTADGGWGFSSC